MRTLLTPILLALALVLSPMVARADNPAREAGKHFQRGVDLYSDGDFRGALVEFKKAYNVWPRANVLYDIGQTEFQLLDYAAALRTMERYLLETGANAPHRQEVESTVETLRGRVGRVAVAAEAGCELTVDDQPAGTTPVDTPILVSVGARKLTLTCPGPRTATRRVEVAAGETVAVELRPPAPPSVALRPSSTAPAREARPPSPTRAFVAGWIATGLLAAGTLALGSAALVEDRKLASLRGTFPVAKSDLDRQSALTTGLAVTTDILGVAALVAAGVSTYLTVKHQRERKLQVGLRACGVQVGGTF